MRYIFIALLLVVFNACSSKKVEFSKENVTDDKDLTLKIKREKPKYIPIADLVNISQNPSSFTMDVKSSDLYSSQKKYEKNYFSIWNIELPPETKEAVKWPFLSYKVGKSYGENLQLLKQAFFDEMLYQSNFENYASVNRRAITLKHLNIRSFPTLRPLLMDPSKAGEGFPFDYLQNSTVQANKPLFVSHYSKNRRWVYIFSSFASGWVQSDEIVFLEKEQTDIWQKSVQVHITKEGTPIYNEKGNFLFNSKVGMMFALIAEDSDSYTVLSISSYKNSLPLFTQSKISKEIASKDILTFGAANLTKIMNELLKTNYGWGGMYEQRDCSSTLRDMFAPFGLWLPRNSYQQSKIGKVINLEDLTSDEKLEVIKNRGIPFQTLLYKKGHIVLYAGVHNGEIIVFHNTWGIKTLKNSKEGRVVVGRTIFSSLKLGENQIDYDEESEILKNLKSMNILTKEEI